MQSLLILIKFVGEVLQDSMVVSNYVMFNCCLVMASVSGLPNMYAQNSIRFTMSIHAYILFDPLVREFYSINQN